MEKDRTEYCRATTPLPEPKNRILNEVSLNGQTSVTASGTQRFVEQKNGIELQPYYHGLLPREDIIALLVQNGDFLLRTTSISQNEPRRKCLSVCWQGVVRHFILTPTNTNTYTLDLAKRTHPEFQTIERLIDFYLHKGQTFSQHNIRLLNAIHRQSWEFRHHQIELGDKLGEGAFGEVYSGFLNTHNNRIAVAIKTLKCSHVTKEKIEESMKEARLMRQCRHQNIVRCYGVAAEEEPLMVLMELVKGGSLDSYLQENGSKIGENERILMSCQAAMAVAYIHSQNVLHRDIAARNCLYGNKCLKLSDFGMSRKAQVYQMELNERVPVRWIAPEVFQTRTYTMAGDVWALGVLIWEIFNDGQEPYADWTGAQVKHEVKENNYRLSMPEGTKLGIVELMKKIWAANPEDRFLSSEVAVVLSTLTKEMPSPLTSEAFTSASSSDSPSDAVLKACSAENKLSEKSITSDRHKKKNKNSVHAHRNHKQRQSKKKVRRHPNSGRSHHELLGSKKTADLNSKHSKSRYGTSDKNIQSHKREESKDDIEVTIGRLSSENVEAPAKLSLRKDEKKLESKGRRKHKKSRHYETVDGSSHHRHHHHYRTPDPRSLHAHNSAKSTHKDDKSSMKSMSRFTVDPEKKAIEDPSKEKNRKKKMQGSKE